MKKLKLMISKMENAEVLTRSQLRNILGGAVMITTIPGHIGGGNGCLSKPCTYYIEGVGTYTGTCGGRDGFCWCMTIVGPYIPTSNGGVSRCKA